ncbi:hypothetical protein RF11_12542 [Thelohanellus kitauei]|uniref:Uncharacterized protein n=1 Tax=Thelohanellus kitauei TaxID=669202 RepID=A0A0C2JVV7_THEKT|nr:hypothetical protein RF11_12542 [Thelohanellus kitauei]
MSLLVWTCVISAVLKSCLVSSSTVSTCEKISKGSNIDRKNKRFIQVECVKIMIDPQEFDLPPSAPTFSEEIAKQAVTRFTRRRKLPKLSGEDAGTIREFLTPFAGEILIPRNPGGGWFRKHLRFLSRRQPTVESTHTPKGTLNQELLDDILIANMMADSPMGFFKLYPIPDSSSDDLPETKPGVTLEVLKPAPVHFCTDFPSTATATVSTYGSAGLTPAKHSPPSSAH